MNTITQHKVIGIKQLYRSAVLLCRLENAMGQLYTKGDFLALSNGVPVGTALMPFASDIMQPVATGACANKEIGHCNELCNAMITLQFPIRVVRASPLTTFWLPGVHIYILWPVLTQQNDSTIEVFIFQVASCVTADFSTTHSPLGLRHSIHHIVPPLQCRNVANNTVALSHDKPKIHFSILHVCMCILWMDPA